MTLEAVRDDGMTVYAPTIVDPQTGAMRVLQGIPEDVPDEEALQDTLERRDLVRPGVLFGVESREDGLVVGEIGIGRTHFRRLDTAPPGSIETVEAPDWWRLVVN